MFAAGCFVLRTAGKDLRGNCRSIAALSLIRIPRILVEEHLLLTPVASLTISQHVRWVIPSRMCSIKQYNKKIFNGRYVSIGDDLLNPPSWMHERPRTFGTSTCISYKPRRSQRWGVYVPSSWYSTFFLTGLVLCAFLLITPLLVFHLHDDMRAINI